MTDAKQPMRMRGTQRYVPAWRWGEAEAGSPLQQIGLAYEGAIKAREKLAQRKSQLASDGRYTDEGRRDRLKEFVENETLPHLGRLRTRILEPRAEQLTGKRSALSAVDPIDPADSATAILHMETRAWLRALPEKERSRAARAGDPMVTQAILAAPEGLSGVSPRVRAYLEKQEMEKRHGDDLAELGEVGEALQAASRALEEVRTEALREAGMVDPGLRPALHAEPVGTNEDARE